MKLYMKQKAFSWRDRFFVYDSQGNEKYRIEGELISIGNRLHVYEGKKEVAVIHEKTISLRPKYEVKAQERFEVIRRLIGIRDHMLVKEFDWEIDGDFIDYEYDIRKGRHKVAEIRRRKFQLTNAYEIDVKDDKDVLNCVATAIAVDAFIAEEREKKHG